MQKDYQAGVEFFKNKDFKSAHESFRKAINSNNTFDEDFYIVAGKAARNINLHIESKEIFEVGINLYTQSSNLYSELGVSYYHLKDLNSALDMLNKAQELEPTNPYRYSSRAYIKGNMGDLDGAISDYEEAAKLDPSDEIIYNNLGLLYEKKGFQKEAKDNFDKSDKILEGKGMGPNINKWKEKESRSKDTVTEPTIEPNVVEEDKAAKKLTTKGYFSTIKSVLTNKKERKEFGQFIKRGLKKK